MTVWHKLIHLADRTAVLALGLVAGFAIGLSFNASGRRQLFGWLSADGAAIVAQPPAPARHRAAAQDAPELAAPVDRGVIDRVARGGHLRVGVFGDSFGDGIWAALYEQLPSEQFDVFRFSKEATGFTRYRTLDLEQRARAQVAHQPIDIAVISFGANDVQPIFWAGHLRPLMGEGWQQVIGERLDRFVAVARSTGAAVFWVGLPVMRDEGMDADIQAMDAFYARHMQRLGVPYIDTRAASLDPQGRYGAYLPDTKTGAPLLMRAGDGVHMSVIGYQRLTSALAARLRRYAAGIRAKAGIGGADRPAPTPPATATPRGGSAPPGAHHDADRTGSAPHRDTPRDAASAKTSGAGDQTTTAPPAAQPTKPEADHAPRSDEARGAPSPTPTPAPAASPAATRPAGDAAPKPPPAPPPHAARPQLDPPIPSPTGRPG